MPKADDEKLRTRLLLKKKCGDAGGPDWEGGDS
jgi:hypothetical protein